MTPIHRCPAVLLISVLLAACGGATPLPLATPRATSFRSDLAPAASTAGHDHWWQYQARPSGDVTLLSEGGDALPSP
jgi:hypothetical protein